MTDETKKDLTTTEPKPARERRVPAKIVKLVDLLLSGACRSTKAACERLNIDPSYASRELRKVHVQAHIESRTRVLIATSQAPAAAAMLRLLDEAKSEHVQKDVAIHLLGIAGIKPTAEPAAVVNVNIRAGYVIDLSDDPPARTIDVTPARK